jgi:hypothetical protein
MKKYQYSMDPKITKIVSNTKYIPYFSFGDHFNEDYSSSSAPSSIDISINIVKDFTRPDGLIQKFQNCYGSDTKDEIYFERHLGLGIKAKLHIKKILYMSEITVNRAYHRYVRFRIDNVYPPGIHLSDILSVNLLEGGYVPVHCAAISLENEAILLIAPPNTGKTLTTILALERGFNYISEDIAVVDKENVYANPYTSTFNHYEDDTNQKKGLFKSISHNIPLITYFVRRSKTNTATNLLKSSKIAHKVKIKKIFILNRGLNDGIVKIEPDDALRKILIINRNEFSYHKNPILFAYSYFNPALDINKLMGVEERIFQNIIDNTDCFLLSSNEPKQYIELIMKT